MKVSAKGLAQIKKFEGLRLTAYKDTGGKPTIGYGLTTGALDGVPVRMGMTISKEQADGYFKHTIDKFSNRVAGYLKREPLQNQFDAMVSMAYNIGLDAFHKSTFLRRFNAGDFDGAAAAMLWFNKVGKKVDKGLVNRRHKEREMFLASGAPEPVANVQPDPERTPIKSKVNMAAVTAGVGTVAGMSGDVKTIISNFGISPNVLLGAVVLGALGFVIYDRVRKMKEHGV